MVATAGALRQSEARNQPFPSSAFYFNFQPSRSDGPPLPGYGSEKFILDPEQLRGRNQTSSSSHPTLFFSAQWLHNDCSIMAVCGALMHTRITLLLLCLEVSLSIHGLSQARPSQHFSSPEVVIPSKVTSRGRGAKAPGWLSYRLRIGGQRHIVHMRVKRLLVSTHLPVFTYTEQHGLQEDHPFVPDDCYYHGYVEGAPESLVALSTCSGGFRGMLQINDLMYEIEPIRHSTTFEHLMYQVGSDETESPHMRCGLTEESIARQWAFQASYNFSLKPRSHLNWWAHWRFVELGVVVDYFRFEYSQSNETIVMLEIFDIINMVDEYYYHIQIDVVLTGIEIWNNGNPIETSGEIDPVLNRFSLWKSLNFDGRLHHDVAHLIIKEFNGALGVAYVSGVCRHRINCGVDVFQDHRLDIIAHTLTHELGHSLGMLHDEKWCTCGEQFCIMHPSREASRRFSNCSYSQYLANTMVTGTCILSPGNPEHVLRMNICGNRVVEDGEQCDCGSFLECIEDPCCLFDCVLKPGAACAFGGCCKDCELLPQGTVCRHPANECDLPEWCNGTSHECPDDVYKQDGILCSTNSYCYENACNNHDSQCKQIFGTEALSASESCYNEMNTQGTRFGHCGIEGTTYVKCMAPDVMCGRVQCENVLTIPTLIEHSTVHQFHLNGTTCWGTDYHLGMSVPDIGEVKDGTVCAPGKMCLRRKCVDMVKASETCQTQHCNMSGVCNNKQHCHCHPGWAPPNCTIRGPGGSVDSGPAPPLPPEENPPVPGSTQNKIMLLPSTLLLIPLILSCLYCFLVLCKKEKPKEEAGEEKKAKEEGEEGEDEGEEEEEEEEEEGESN
ncbi:disintegrin and metalloproteinase domain-containing protein 20-like isoform X2 [Oryctolagus cuniculus]|uniref:disintegrin and metalloproteinase domain-containing protein 20-like isoform X2 n=2 Tax=Oryctolagus cuniculus TaxID=9986 RepID=UPI00222EFF99|nr:disintegrin and metalloproteinase domain-containing protein 20-like [Oryctolagus cuniculus]